MCGIVGHTFGSNESNFHQTSMIERISHRGPDAVGTFQNGTIWLGHTRLSIIDLSSAANQPFHSSDNRYVMVYNGEVYNHLDLAKSYAIPMRTSSDTEVVLELYAHVGTRMPGLMNGMFAGAIFDNLTGETFLFRDRLGIKPLYYTVQNGCLIFASELPALLNAIPKPSINESAIATFLHRGYIPEPDSIYTDIYKFPSGSWAVFSEGKLRIESYWRAEDHFLDHTFSNEKKVIDEVHERLRSSVGMRLMADVPFGTFLSGGADSGLISAIAADISPSPIHTFNVGFADATFDETPFATAMASHIGSMHHNINVSKKEAMDSLEEGMSIVGEPFADSSIFPTKAVSKFASQYVKMALSGDGGDELFMGYGAYNWAERLSNPAVRISRKSIARLLRLKGDARSRRAANVFDFRKTDNINAHIFSQEQNLFTAKEIETITGAAFRDPFDSDIFKTLPRKLSSAEQQSFFDLTNYLKDDLLVKVDRASMRHGLEVRVPFLDHTLVEYALNIDPALKSKNRESKYPIKKILETYYPNNLIYRQKWGFSIPLEKWLKDSDYLLNHHLTLPDNFSKKYNDLMSNYLKSNDFSFNYNRLYTLKNLGVYL